MRILMIPARRNSTTNAYAALMTEALERSGCVVDDVSAKRSLLPLYQIVHLHWPQVYALERSLPVAMLRSVALVLMLWLQRLFGARVVWTVHDVGPFPSGHRWLEALLMSLIVPAMSGLVFLSESSMEMAFAIYPTLAAKPRVTVPHALYGDIYPPVGSAAARMALGLPPEREVVGYIGDIKAYKGLDLLLDAYAKAGPAAPVLLVAGAAPYDAELSAATKRQVDAVTSAGAPVAWVNRRLSTEDFSGGLAASDLVIAPYRTSWNSGIATLALEHGRPLLCTDLPIFRELQSEVGADWVRLFTPPLTLERVVSAVAEGQPESADAMERLRAFRERRSWTAAGREIGAFYSRLCNLAQRQS